MNEYLQIVLNAALTGVGVAIGTYLAQKGLLHNFERLLEALKKNGKEQVTTL